MRISPAQWSDIQTAAAASNITEAARAYAIGAKLNPQETHRFVVRVKRHAARHHWTRAYNAARASALQTALSVAPVAPLSLSSATVPPMPREESPLPPVANMLLATLARRKARSQANLARYVDDAARRLAKSRGDLGKARQANDVARTRAAVWPEAAQPIGELAVTLDETGRVQAIQARLRARLAQEQPD